MGKGMGKKKKKKESLPWCWYCDREFENEKVLVDHQKAKHFKCHICHKRMNTAGGFTIHMQNVHKEEVKKVPNALPGRDTTDIEIFGMEGIPEADLIAHEGGDEDEDGTAKKARTDTGGPAGGAAPAWPMGMPPYGMPPYGRPPIPPGPFPGAPPFMPPYGAPMAPWGNPMMRPPFMPPGAAPPPFGAPPFGVPPGPFPGYPGAPPPFPPVPMGLPPRPAGVPPPAAAQPEFRTTPPPSAEGYVPPVSYGVPPTTAPAPPASATRTDSTTAAIPGQQDDSRLVYDDNDLSMEEKRASLGRYQPKTAAATQSDSLRTKVQQLDQSIESRLSNLEGFFQRS